MTVDLETKPNIRELSTVTISRIAAGEVVERPASAVKELVENSLDAGATEITVKIEAGGKNLIFISDNGCGMTKNNLSLAVRRHTTSKLIEDDLLNIKHFGFRGEALPSIASVSRMTIKSRPAHLTEGYMLTILGGEKQSIAPTAHHIGTTVEVRDLFYATPARLKFLRNEKTEIQHIVDLLKRIALANPKASLKFYSDNKILLNFPKNETENPLCSRISEVFNKEFIDNSIGINVQTDNVKLSGYISLPTYDKGTSAEQYLYVNKRPVKDKLLFVAIRIAYQNFISRDRFPMVVLFLDVPPELVDVNAHPAKTEVRFRDVHLIRNILIGALKNALLNQGHLASSTIANDALRAATVEKTIPQPRKSEQMPFSSVSQTRSFSSAPSPKPHINKFMHDFAQPVVKGFEENETDALYEQYKLGAARCQMHETYIISQTKNSIIIVDQHAAHERLVYEQLKQQLEDESLSKQRLLIPEIIELNPDIMEKLLKIKENLSKLGLQIEHCTSQSIIVTEIPALLGDCNVKKLIQNIIDDIIEFEENISFKELINHILATYACHHSIRSGRQMNKDEMNNLLREMENTHHSGQCNHGRPTYIELQLKDIDKLFGRT